KPDGTTEEDEKEADKWSGDILIDPKEFALFKEAKDYSKAGVLSFADRLGIAPGIVVGRMQKEGMIRYNMMNNLKVQYKLTV
ncbi:MAG: XRE family transcriptional regulator, partial [Solobacterium sp.]|nr:XRE family transcriptional regulator [Solobacterium sp.]